MHFDVHDYGDGVVGDDDAIVSMMKTEMESMLLSLDLGALSVMNVSVLAHTLAQFRRRCCPVHSRRQCHR